MAQIHAINYGPHYFQLPPHPLPNPHSHDRYNHLIHNDSDVCCNHEKGSRDDVVNI